MASASSTNNQHFYSGDVHIPLCEAQFCHRKLTRLAEELTNRGFKCVSQYKPYGMYKSQFKKAFNNCTFTVLHHCLYLWNKIASCDSLISEYNDKIWAVNFEEEFMLPDANAIGLMTRSELMEEKCNNFFEEFKTPDIFSDEEMIEFANKMEQHLKEEIPEACSLYDINNKSTFVKVSDMDSKPRHTKIDLSQLPQKSLIPQLDYQAAGSSAQERESLEGEFVKCFDLFGLRHSHAFVRGHCLTDFQREASVEYSSQDDCIALMNQINEEWSQAALTKEGLISKIKHISFKVIPELYKSRHWIGLVCLAASTQEVIQEKALTLLELLFLQEHDSDKIVDFKSLYNAEALWRQAMKDLLIEYKRSSDTNILPKVERMASLYLMLLSQLTLMEKTPHESVQCTTVFETICGTLFSSNFECLENINSFVRYICEENPARVKQMVDKMSSKVFNLIEENNNMQVLIVYQLLRKLFKTMDPQVMHRLKKLLKKTEVTKVLCLRKLKKLHSAAIVLVIRGLTTFLHFGFRRATDKDVASMCSDAVKVIKVAESAKEAMQPLVQDLLSKLLCDPKAAVRADVLLFLKASQDPRKAERMTLSNNPDYKEKAISLLRGHIEKLLSPLLTLEPTVLPHDEDELKMRGQTWVPLNGQFDNKEVLVLMKLAESGDGPASPSEADRHHLRELAILKELKHFSIIRLFAFQENNFPTFYVVENYKQSNLQTALKNGCDNKDFILKSLLAKYALDALSALEFCHRHGYIHRNLTTDSLFTVGGEGAKLCGFHLACQLKSGQDKEIDHSKPSIPTLWSAPESLDTDEYSRESDVWMAGHLLYELFTHGVMPYSHKETQSDAQIVRMIKSQSIALSEEPCIDAEVDKIIQECSHPVPQSRPSIDVVKSQFAQFFSTLKDTTQKQRYPAAVEGVRWKSSKDYTKGTRRSDDTSGDLNERGGKRDFVALSDMITRCNLGDEYVFTEKILHTWPSDMLWCIRNGALQGLLPALRVIQNERESPQLELRIPSSCLGSVERLCLRQLLGTSLPVYLFCALKVAVLMEKLHELSWALGDLHMSNLYVQVQPTDLKVHVVSLAYLQYGQLSEQISPDVRNYLASDRAAPEVVRYGQLSSNSDIFCFGKLIVDILNTFSAGEKETKAGAHEEDVDHEDVSVHMNQEDDFNTGLQTSCESEGLKALIASCLKDRHRPKASELVTQLSRILSEDYKLTWDSEEKEGFISVASICSSLNSGSTC